MNLKLTSILNEYSTGVVNKLKEKFKKENSALTDDQIEYYINRFDQLKSSPKVEEKDIAKYSFQQLEKLVDSFPTKEKVKKQEDGNTVEFSQTELIYNKAPLQIYHGSNERTCIKIKGDFPASWCVSRSTGGNMYNGYRYAGTEPSFYFVKNLDRLNKITEIEDDLYCFFVIQFNNQGKYIVTNAKNDGDREMSWDDILQIEPLLQGTESLFKNVPLTDEEREYSIRFGNGISNEEYNDLSYKEKKIYIFIRRDLTNKQFKNTPNDLLNDYITTGVELTRTQFDFIKDKRQLFNNYRRVTIDNVIPEYLKDNILFWDRWLVLTDDEAVDLYNKKRKTLDNEADKYFLGKDVLECKPMLLDKIDINVIAYLVRLDTLDIKNNLIKFPTLIDKYKDILYKLDSYDVKLVLESQPQLVEYFEDRLKDDEVLFHSILMEANNITYFIKYLKLLSTEEISIILEREPQLAPYFEKQGLLKESLKYPPLRTILKR
jgi:hypothetical protein